MITRRHMEQNFFAEADALRDVLDGVFRSPYKQAGLAWQYFCVPEMYTYLRARPQDVFPQPLLSRFMERLRGWCLERLGLVPIGEPNLHLMVNGCRLNLHSDFHNGAWGYVFSLTRWRERKFRGGETLLFKDGVPSYKKYHVHGDSLYDAVPAEFNQLLVFDDRIVHGTPCIEGSMDPTDARIALVGHVRAGSPTTVGAASDDAVRSCLRAEMAKIAQATKPYKDVQGTIAYRLDVSASGQVERTAALSDTLVTPVTGYEGNDAVRTVRAIVTAAMSRMRFPVAAAPSSITAAVLIPVPDLEPLEVTARAVDGDALGGGLSDLVHAKERLTSGIRGLRGSWSGTRFLASEPIAGEIDVRADGIAARFDAPMWVPSQREHFKVEVTEALKKAAAAGVREVHATSPA